MQSINKIKSRITRPLKALSLALILTTFNLANINTSQAFEVSSLQPLQSSIQEGRLYSGLKKFPQAITLSTALRQTQAKFPELSIQDIENITQNNDNRALFQDDENQFLVSQIQDRALTIKQEFEKQNRNVKKDLRRLFQDYIHYVFIDGRWGDGSNYDIAVEINKLKALLIGGGKYQSLEDAEGQKDAYLLSPNVFLVTLADLIGSSKSKPQFGQIDPFEACKKYITGNEKNTIRNQTKICAQFQSIFYNKSSNLDRNAGFLIAELEGAIDALQIGGKTQNIVFNNDCGGSFFGVCPGKLKLTKAMQIFPVVFQAVSTPIWTGDKSIMQVAEKSRSNILKELSKYVKKLIGSGEGAVAFKGWSQAKLDQINKWSKLNPKDLTQSQKRIMREFEVYYADSMKCFGNVDKFSCEINKSNNQDAQIGSVKPRTEADQLQQIISQLSSGQTRDEDSTLRDQLKQISLEQNSLVANEKLKLEAITGIINEVNSLERSVDQIYCKLQVESKTISNLIQSIWKPFMKLYPANSKCQKKLS